MKAIKISKIEWNTGNVSAEKREEILKSLPKSKGMIVKDDFNALETLPNFLKKKYGYEIFSYHYSTITIPNTLDELLLVCAPQNEKVKKLFKDSGDLTPYGKKCKDELESYIKARLRMEFEGKDESEMPNILDSVMLGVEKVTGMTWGGHTVGELMKPITKKILNKKVVNLKDKDEMEEDY